MLPSIGQKNITTKLSRFANKSVEEYIKGKGVFSEDIIIKEDALPSAPSISELSQAGREVGADIVLLGKLVEFDGSLNYGFKP